MTHLKLNTFTIVARCKRTNQLGIATATAIPAVGSLVPYAKARVGVVAVQAQMNPYDGLGALQLLEKNRTPDETMNTIIDKQDPLTPFKQIVLIDRHGKVAAFTGENCDSWAGHLTGENYGIAANMASKKEILTAMEKSFLKDESRSLDERLLLALEAGDATGGDKRGKMSAALYVAGQDDYPYVDLRVDYHEDPVLELKRIHQQTAKRIKLTNETLPSKTRAKGKVNVEKIRALIEAVEKDNNN